MTSLIIPLNSCSIRTALATLAKNKLDELWEERVADEESCSRFLGMMAYGIERVSTSIQDRIFIQQTTGILVPPTLVDKVFNKTLKKQPDCDLTPDILRMHIIVALHELKKVQRNTTVFPIIQESGVFPLIVTSKEEGYLTLAARKGGGYKQFYIAVRVQKEKVNARAKLVIKDAKKFEAKGLRVDPLDFISPYVISKSEFSRKVGNKIILIKPLFDGDILDQCENWTVNQTLQVMRQALLGLKAFHDHGYLHVDVKPQNFFVKTKINKLSGAEERKVVLADEDSAFKIGGDHKLNGLIYSGIYTAPEALPTLASDMYSFGHSLETMFLYKRSNISVNEQKALDSLDILIGRLTVDNPVKRPTAAEALKMLDSIEQLI